MRTLPILLGLILATSVSAQRDKVEESKVTVGPWIVRIERIPIETPRPIGLAYRKFYVRKGADGDEWFAFGSPFQSGHLLTVLDDGTLAIGASSTIYWVPFRGKARQQILQLGKDNVNIARAWPDGMVVGPYWLNRPAPYYFVPIKGAGKDATLDLAERVPLTGDAHTYALHKQFERVGDRLVWLTDKAWRKTVSLCVFDLKTAKVSTFPFVHDWCELHSWDGQYALIRLSHKNTNLLFDTMRGYPVGMTHEFGPVAQREGFDYYLLHEFIEPKDPGGLSYYQCRLSVFDRKVQEPAEKILWQDRFYTGFPEVTVHKEGVRVTTDKMTRTMLWEKRAMK